jgi:hypothetical protein
MRGRVLLSAGAFADYGAIRHVCKFSAAAPALAREQCMAVETRERE